MLWMGLYPWYNLLSNLLYHSVHSTTNSKLHYRVIILIFMLHKNTNLFSVLLNQMSLSGTDIFMLRFLAVLALYL